MQMAREKKSPRPALKPDCHVYRNLHKALWSVRSTATRRVVDRPAALDLADCEFKVSAAGHARAVREGRRNVHAVVAGRRVRPHAPAGETPVELTYNPFRSPFFLDRATGRPLVRAARVRFLATGRAVAYRPEFAP